MMVNRLNRNRSISQILVVAIALVLVAGLFCGAGAAATSLDWASYAGATGGDISITEASGSTLSHKITLTISQNASIDFGDAKTYVLTGSTTSGGCGGLVDKLVFSDASKTLTIKNLHITGSGTITFPTYGIGGLFGRIESTNGTLILENCSINGVTIGSSSSCLLVGGLVGYADSVSLNIEMKNCTIENCNISSSSSRVGGLVGYAGSASLNLSGCMVAFSNVTSSSFYVGGLVGHASSASLNMSGCMVDRVYVKGSSGYVGGLVGGADSASVVNCANTIVNGTEVISSSDGVGGLVGATGFVNLNMNGCIVENSKIWSSSSNGVGGLVGRASSTSLMNLNGCMVEKCTVSSSSSNNVGGLVGYADAIIDFIGNDCWVNESWVYGVSDIGSLVGNSSSVQSPLVAPQHSAVYSASSTTGSTAIANNDFDGIGTKEQYGSPIDRYGLVAGKDYGYISSTPSVVTSGTCGTNLTWVLTNDGTLTISGTGAMDDYSAGTAPWSSYRSNMTKLVLPNGLTTIGNYTFFGCDNFTGSLTIPNNVTTIGGNAFGFCNGFTGSLTIPNSVTTISEEAFCNCNGFTGSLTIPNSVTTIGGHAFLFCTGFTGSLTIPNSVTTIGTGAFYGCSGITGSLTIPNSITTIGNSTFSYCSGITNVTIPSSVTSIGVNAFCYCSGITNVTIPSSVTSIGVNAFNYLHANSVIYAECSASLVSGNYSTDCTALAEKGTNNAYTFTVDSTSFPSGFTLTSDNAPVKENATFAGWYTSSSYSGSTVSTVTDGQTLYAKWSNSSSIIASGTCGTNLTWVLTDDWTLTISGTGAMDDYSYNSSTGRSDAPWNSYYLNMTTLVLPDGLTTIGDYAFYWCSGFTGSLSIPNSVTTIGTMAFLGCDNFTGSLTIPNSVTIINSFAFCYCSGFTGSLTLSDNLTTIDLCAFTDCSGFTGSLTIPNNVISIQKQAFSNCGGFTGSLTIPNSVTTISELAFSGCSGFAGSLIIPNSVTSIGDLAFQDCSGFTGSLALSNNLTTIGANPFSSCSNISTITVDLSNPNYSSDSHGILYNKNSSSIICCPAGKRGEVTIPNSVRTIAEYAFCGCSAFNGSLTIPNSVTTISEYAFHGCSGFTGPLTIPNSVTTISECAFHGCSGFNGSLTIPNSVASIDSFAFSQCSGFTGPLTIPNSITTIRNGAFSQCSGFTGPLTIPNSVTTIGELAFFGCNGFSGSLIIGNNVMTIGSDAFNGCYGITNVTIPSSVTSIASIGGNVFVSLHQNSIIYAECSASLVSGNYSEDRTALAEKGTNNAYTFTVDSTSFPSGFTLTSDNAPVKSNVTFEGWYTSSSYSGSKVTKVTNGQTLYAKWMAPTTHQLSTGWNVVSIPHTPTAAYDTVSELFTGVDTADHSIYVYNGKTKVWEPATSSTAISPLNAYWVYAASPTVISCLYDTSSSTLPSKTVYTGWNLVGISAPESISAATAFTSVDWLEYHEWNASAQGYNPTLVKGGSGTAADTNNVSIWNGGWLSMNTNGTYTGSI